MNHHIFLIAILLVLTFGACAAENHDTPPLDWKSYQDTICLNIFRGEIVLPALGHGKRCGHPTPNCNQAYCGACAASLGVCAVCGKKNDWTRNTDPDVEVPLLFALLENSPEIEPRRIALHALTQIRKADTLARMMKFSRDQDLSLQLASAIGAFQDRRYTWFLKRVLHRAGSHFWEQEDYEAQYYRLAAARAAAAALAALGDRRSEKILLAAAQDGDTLVQMAALGALAEVDSDRSRQVLSACLREFFARDRDWKWIPGRDLIGTALKSLAAIGKKKEALLVLSCMKEPGCDFLYTDLGQCLAKIGRPILPEIIAAIREGVRETPYDQGTTGLIEVLGDLNDPSAASVLREMLDWQYSDQWVKQDATQKAIAGLGKLKAHEAVDRIGFELLHSADESTRYQAALALGQIGGLTAFARLEERVRQGDADWVRRQALASLNELAFQQMKTEEVKLRALRACLEAKAYEAFFSLAHGPVLNGEAWVLDLFLAHLEEVPLRQHFYQVVDLLESKDPEVGRKVLAFLERVTGLEVPARTPPEDKTRLKQAFQEWYAAHYQELS